jgi:hypothetical protein
MSDEKRSSLYEMSLDECVRLRAEREKLKADAFKVCCQFAEADSERVRLRADNRRLREALEPACKIMCGWCRADGPPRRGIKDASDFWHDNGSAQAHCDAASLRRAALAAPVQAPDVCPHQHGNPPGDYPDCCMPAQVPEPERIVQAAILTTGPNYAECFRNKLSRSNTQGFVTSTGRFVDRVEALRIATAAGKLVGRTKHHPLNKLTSEDLWDVPYQPTAPAAAPTEPEHFCYYCRRHHTGDCPKPAADEPTPSGEPHWPTDDEFKAGGVDPAPSPGKEDKP